MSNDELSTKLRNMTANERWAVKLCLVREDGQRCITTEYETNGEAAWAYSLDCGYGLELQPYDHFVGACDSVGDADFIYYVEV